MSNDCYIEIEGKRVRTGTRFCDQRGTSQESYSTCVRRAIEALKYHEYEGADVREELSYLEDAKAVLLPWAEVYAFAILDAYKHSEENGHPQTGKEAVKTFDCNGIGLMYMPDIYITFEAVLGDYTETLVLLQGGGSLVKELCDMYSIATVKTKRTEVNEKIAKLERELKKLKELV